MEILITLSARSLQKQNYLYLRPEGSVVSAISAESVRRKWFEIFGDLMRPEKRVAFDSFEYYAQASVLWLPAYYDLWMTVDRQPERLDEMWALLMADGRIAAGMPNDPDGEVKVYERWNWSSVEQTGFLTVALDAEVEGLDKRGDYERGGKQYSGPLWKFDWEQDFGYSQGKRNDIRNPNKRIRHKHSEKQPSAKKIDVRING